MFNEFDSLNDFHIVFTYVKDITFEQKKQKKDGK